MEKIVVNKNSRILVTGANGFIGTKVVEYLLNNGFVNIICFVRPTSNINELIKVLSRSVYKKNVKIMKGNLLNREDCINAAEGVEIVYHLAAARGEKSVPDAFLNSVVTSRNLIESISRNGNIKRFVLVSSFTVYDNGRLKRGGILDEGCPIEKMPALRGEAYCYAKVKQEIIVTELCKNFSIPYIILRPGVVYGPGNKGIHGRVGIGTFGIFLHLGGSNRIPLTYVDNCAEAIALSGIREGVYNEVFNIVDDDLPTSEQFLCMYKKNVKRFRSLNVPYKLFYLFCYLWEKYSKWSQGQLPPVFNRKKCSSYWKGNVYSNKKIKRLLLWSPRVRFNEAIMKYLEYQREVVK